MLEFERKERYDFYDLAAIMRLLRSEGGCPWDREQTHQSIKRNLLEEAYECAEAIDEGDTDHLCEELGDVLMQVVFHSSMEEELGHFDIDGVSDRVCRKLIERHPHVFGDVHVDDSDEVIKNWDEIKRRSRSQKSRSSEMGAVSRALPALWRAEKIQSKAAGAGFDWNDIWGAIAKLEEEIRELKEAVSAGRGIPEELGDILFSAVNVARFAGVDPEDALNSCSEKFISRFAYIEKKAEEKGTILSDMSLEEMDELWNESKSVVSSGDQSIIKES